jgi:hypothetical protein
MKLLLMISFLNLTTSDLTCLRELYQSFDKNKNEASLLFDIADINAKQKRMNQRRSFLQMN